MKISFWLALLAPFLLAVVAALGNAAQAQVLATAEVLGVDDSRQVWKWESWRICWWSTPAAPPRALFLTRPLVWFLP